MFIVELRPQNSPPLVMNAGGNFCPYRAEAFVFETKDEARAAAYRWRHVADVFKIVVTRKRRIIRK